MPSRPLIILASMLIAAGAQAQGRSLTDAQLRGIGFVELPAMSKRKVVGQWLDTISGTNCTRSIHEVMNRYYEVTQCGGAKDNQWGKELNKVGVMEFRPRDDNQGTYYLIDRYGRLLVRDRDGLIDALPAHR